MADALQSPMIPSGFKSSEFWITLITGIVAILGATNIIPVNNQYVQSALAIVAMLKTMNYTMARANLKKASIAAGVAAATAFVSNLNQPSITVSASTKAVTVA